MLGRLGYDLMTAVHKDDNLIDTLNKLQDHKVPTANTHTILSSSICTILVMMRSKERKTSRFVFMLILSMIFSLFHVMGSIVPASAQHHHPDILLPNTIQSRPVAEWMQVQMACVCDDPKRVKAAWHRGEVIPPDVSLPRFLSVSVSVSVSGSGSGSVSVSTLFSCSFSDSLYTLISSL